MDTSVVAQLESDRYEPAAGPIHTICVLVVLGGWAIYGKLLVDHLNTAVNFSPIRFYVLTIACEWAVFVLVVLGVRQSGTPVNTILGQPWSSMRQLLRDIGIAAGFWVSSTGILAFVFWLLRLSGAAHKLDFMKPHGSTELTVWVFLSVTAGICEESIFRGYLQRQFIAITKNVPIGILLSAAGFGAGHAYQGFRSMIFIGVYGAMFGVLAHWRRNIRPGIIAHAWHDAMVGVIAALTNR
jgi:membrane protease YdiL (CAAX protease family)